MSARCKARDTPEQAMGGKREICYFSVPLNENRHKGAKRHGASTSAIQV